MAQGIRLEFLSLVESLRALSPVSVAPAPEIRYLLMRRYVAVVTRNTTFSLALLAVVLAGFGRRAPTFLLVAIWGVTALLYWLREILRRRALHRMTPSGRDRPGRYWLRVLPGISIVVWSLAPLVLHPWLDPLDFLCMISAGLGVVAMIAVSYVAALPACVVFLTSNGTLIVVALALQGTFSHLLLAGLAVATVFTLIVRVTGLHGTLVQALTAEQTKGELARQLQAHRDALASENDKLGLSLLAAADAAHRDPLTGLYNRRYVEEFVATLKQRVDRGLEKVAACVVDIDHFKRVNDTYGHPAGDEVIREVSARLEGRLREGDVLARMGGEEFLALLRSCDLKSAVKVAEGVRTELASRPILTTAGDVHATVSVGVALWTSDETFDELFQRADQALYAAKENGRNRTVADGMVTDQARKGRPSSYPGSLH